LRNFCVRKGDIVVFLDLFGVTLPFTLNETVESMPTFLPADRKICSIMWTVVVLPFVPVTPMQTIFLPGRPYLMASLAKIHGIEVNCIPGGAAKVDVRDVDVKTFLGRQISPDGVGIHHLGEESISL